MNLKLGEVVLRRPEPRDIEALLVQKNDPEIALQLGGFHAGYSRADLVEWIERHRSLKDEVLWVIAAAGDDTCLGHVGLYQIDQRVRTAEFAIMIGERKAQGRGLGRAVTRAVLEFGFAMLNLNRISLSLLSNNTRALRLYESLGFRHEGTLRQAQFKSGHYLDVELMSILREEFNGHST